MTVTRVVVVAGVSGTGKSTVGRVLAAELNWAFTEGDALHPAANVAKMRAGVPLSDADRQPWLAAVGARIDEYLAAGQPAVLTCSALKAAYRALLTRGRPAVAIVVLDASREVLAARLQDRHGHFFPARLLDSQLADLELPSASERHIVVGATGEPAQIAGQIIRRLRLRGMMGS